MANYRSSCESNNNLMGEAENESTISNKTYADDSHSANKNSENGVGDSGKNKFLFDESPDSLAFDIVTPISYDSEVIVTTSDSLNDLENIAQQDSLKSHQHDLMFGIPLCCSQVYSFEGFGSKPFQVEKHPQNENLYRLESTEKSQQPEPIKSPGELVFQTFIEEDSCNAVDIQISKNVGNSTHRQTVRSLNSDDNDCNRSSNLSFKGKIKSLDQTQLTTQKCLGQSEISQRLTSNSSQFSRSFILKKYSNEKSPDLFAEDEQDELHDHVDKETQEHKEYKQNLKTIPERSTLLNEAQPTDISCCPTESDFGHDDHSKNCSLAQGTSGSSSDSYTLFKENCRREREMLRRIRKCLAGVLPPPSVTIPQLDLVGAVLSKKDDIFDFINDIKDEKSKQIAPTDDSSNFSISSSLFKPTHSLEETKNMPWRDILSVRQHGLCYNLNRASENNEYLSLAVTERFIGAETASSYTNSPSSAKKRSTRLKLLSQSPGNRLSHLAKRRSIFSYASLAAQKTSTLLKPQIMLNEKKTKNRRKISSNHFGMSNRTLVFTAEEQQRNKDNKLISTMPYFALGTTKQLDTSLKRKRNHCDENDDAETSEVISQSSKVLKTNDSSGLTPRALNIKSQSFCIAAGPSTSGSSISQTHLPHTNSGSSLLGSKLQKAYSDSLTPKKSLTDSEKKKLLWAVSQALQERKITTKHESFKQYASILVQVVRRIFLEFYQNSSTSNSETMLRLTKKYVCSVITGSTSDDIYLQAKKHIEDTKRQSTTRLSGYIGPEEYQQLRQQSSQSLYSQSQSLTGSSQNISSVGSSLNSFSLLSQTSSGFCGSTNDMTMSQTSFLGQMSQGLLHTDTTQNSNSRSDTKTLQTCSALQKSSSKSNLFGVVLRENVDCDVRRSAQNNFTAEDERNMYRASTTNDRRYCTKARRQISFDI